MHHDHLLGIVETNTKLFKTCDSFVFPLYLQSFALLVDVPVDMSHSSGHEERLSWTDGRTNDNEVDAKRKCLIKGEQWKNDPKLNADELWTKTTHNP